MVRRSGPTLYEAMSKTAASGTTPAPTGRRPAATESDRPATPVLFTPGSMVRLPVGYVWVLLIAAVLAMVGAYLLGHGRGESAGRTAMQQTLAAVDRVTQETARVREPDAAGERSTAASPSPSPQDPVSTPSTNRGDVPRPPAGGGVVAAGEKPPSVLLDRRTSGKWYYQLITTRHSDAITTAEVVREAVADLGLDAQVVQGDNPGLSSVILLPGFDRRSQTDDERRNWDDRMRLLRSRVAGKLKFSGDQPFGDAFPILHR